MKALEMDGDGLGDGEEDIDFADVKDTLEPDPLLANTDGDGIPDGTEHALMHANASHSGWTVTHDYDGDGKSDLTDKDADNDGLDDGWEDWNLNATISSVNQTNPYDNDTEDDLLLDGAEPSPYVDSDGDGNINARDTNSNGDSYTDDRQVWVVFRTNATDGNYVGAGKWIALIAPSANPDTRTDGDYSASSALYAFAEELPSPPGAAQIQNPYGPAPASDVTPLETPEGYAVLWVSNGSSYDIFIDLPGSTYAKYTKNGSPPSDYTTSNRNVSSFLANKQETYDGRAALNPDTDFDGVNNTRETNCGLNSSNPDTDGDGISDGKEYRASCWDTDLDGHPDANDTDSDNDGILDNLEDLNLNGRWGGRRDGRAAQRHGPRRDPRRRGSQRNLLLQGRLLRARGRRRPGSGRSGAATEDTKRVRARLVEGGPSHVHLFRGNCSVDTSRSAGTTGLPGLWPPPGVHRKRGLRRFFLGGFRQGEATISSKAPSDL